ncbi:MAG TPA: alpha/beta fold hydrolase [Solirubrobacterales bacterium]|jgi:pimeloyl-ACP methyl ester carboxylesterase|nr:alpha/beta fold hydrolase [Solirubrobacterales bacterium]
MVCLHGFVDTWRTWELVLPELEREHDVFAPTLAGHAGGPPLDGEIPEGILTNTVERQMDEAGIETAHLVGCSLGGYVALKLAARGRARSVVALAPAGGWAAGDQSFRDTLAFFTAMQDLLVAAVPNAEAILSTPEGRRRAIEFAAVNYEHIPADLLAHQMRGAAICTAAVPLIEYAGQTGWNLEAEKITCPVRIVWGTADRLLPWPPAAARFRNEWLPLVDWVVLDGVGHALQMDVPEETARLILEFTS